MFIFISYSAHMSGFIIHALALKLPPKGNGIVPLVKEILLGEKAVNKMIELNQKAASTSTAQVSLISPSLHKQLVPSLSCLDGAFFLLLASFADATIIAKCQILKVLDQSYNGNPVRS